ncbi:hypothetical protein HY639_05320 [Candidatus Woesearchaeota archaeon]|nr:hypothetical protein [Candidatus Woesearchaeota archaeon]
MVHTATDHARHCPRCKSCAVDILIDEDGQLICFDCGYEGPEVTIDGDGR